MRVPMTIRPAADQNAPSRYPTPAHIPVDAEDRFLSALAEFGQVTYACNVCGMARRSLYARRQRDREFAERWDEAVDLFEETLTQRVIHTALHMGTGRWVPAVDPETGQQELDDDFELLYRFDCSHVDPRIAVKLLALRVRSVNDVPAVSIQNNTQVNAAPTPVAGPPLDVEAILAEYEEAEDD